MKESAPVIFVVDDEEAVREGLARLLDSAGYDVVEFASPETFLLTHSRRAHAPSAIGQACRYARQHIGTQAQQQQQENNQQGSTQQAFMPGTGALRRHGHQNLGKK